MTTPGHTVTVSDPVTGKEVFAWVLFLGEDLMVAVGGGEKPHVGCVVLATPIPSLSKPGAWSASCSVFTISPHKEEPIARAVASRVAAACGRVAVVTAGVHDDRLDPVGIESYLRLGDQLADKVVELVQSLSTDLD